MGVLRIYIGEQTKPHPNATIPRGRVVEEGFALSEEDAQNRLVLYIRKHQWTQISKARRRAAARS